MEDLLNHLAREAGTSKHSNIRLLAEQARNFTESQQGLLRDPPWELRAKCLEAVRAALNSGSNKLISLAIQGLQKMLRDDRFASPFESEDESLWLTNQLLDVLPPMTSLSDDAQVEIMRVLLNATCQSSWVANNALVVRILTLCHQLYTVAPTAGTVATAALATACQAVRGFSAMLDEDFESAVAEQQDVAGSAADADPVGVYEDILPTYRYLCDQLQQHADKRSVPPSGHSLSLQFHLSTLMALLSALPVRVQRCGGVLEQTWRHLTPALVRLLGSPTTERVSSHHAAAADTEMGRGSGGLDQQPSLRPGDAKLIYSMSVELVRLLGGVASIRPVLESLFHRMLLYPPPQHREDALRTVKQVLKTPELLLPFCGPVLVEQTDKQPHVNDLSLLLLLLDSVLECNGLSEPASIYTNICCCVALLQSLETLCEGRQMPPEYVARINGLYTTLEEADYTGPVTYQSPDSVLRHRLRLPVGVRFPSESSLASSYLPGRAAAPADTDRSGTGYESDGSDATEGPEDSEFTDDLDELTSEAEEADRRHREEESCRLQRLRGDEGELPRVAQYYDSSSEQERRNCRHFVQTLRALLPSLMAIRSCLEVDQAVQQFASKYCDGLYSSQPDLSTAEPHQLMVLNADGVYLACYSALLLNLKMIRSGYYSGKTAALTVTEAEFVEEVLGSGVLVYLSTAWLAELYQQVLSCDLLQQAGYTPSQCRPALLNLLADLDGLGSIEQGSQLLSDYRRLERAAANIDRDPAVEAGVKFSRRVLTACWDSLLEVLSTLLSAPSRHGLYPSLALDGGRQQHRRLREAAVVALDGLQRATRLSNVAGLQRRCGSVFSFLTAASCGDGGEDASQRRARPRLPLVSSAPVRLHSAHVLSMDVILGKGLDLGSHSSTYWPHIFRCVVYLGDVERRFFSKHSNQVRAPKVSPAAKPTRYDNDTLQLTFSQCEDDGSESDDPYGYLVSPASLVTPNIDIAAVVRESGADDNNGGVLPDQYVARAICGLTQQADRLFDDAAHKLNLAALLSFLRELCRASQGQLFAAPAAAAPAGFWRRRRPAAGCDPAAGRHDMLLLSRLGDVVLKVARSGRPLVHLIKAWSVVCHHLMEAACHKELAVSKKAVCYIHDTVNALLNSQSELPHFHVNEALFKPLETLLCLELCDTDVQDQIVGSICEFVEVNTAEIRSGWRPLFGALRSVRVDGSATSPPPTSPAPAEPRATHVRIVLDVFEAFLNTGNVLVFSNAAVDCILCLLKHVRGPTELQDNNWDQQELVIEVGALGATQLDLCRAALRYIGRCHAILASMYGMRSCPVFHSAHRIQLNTVPQTVDPSLADETSAPVAARSAADKVVTYERLAVQGAVTDLDQLDNSSGILRVWYLLLEGLAGATATCPRRHQPRTMETLFTLLRSLADRPGAEFGIYCVNHLLLPMAQGWLRRAAQRYRGWQTFAPNFKQCCGLATDLVVFYHKSMPADASERHRAGVDLMMRQLLLVMMECVCQPHEVVSRLGCACIRHLVISGGSDGFSPAQWELVTLALHRALALTLRPLRRLMAAFDADSENFYGDIGQVKVAARRDCTGRESDRLRQLAHQVFLLDNQRPVTLETSDQPEAEDRSYVFLLYPADGGEAGLVRVPFRDLVVGLLAHQILLQTAGAVLLQGTPHVVPSLANVLLHTPPSAASRSSEPSCPPGFLWQLSADHVHTLLDGLASSQRAAVEFDSRPGLKFLVQKVSGAERAANLYRQAGASWTLRAVTLLDLGLAALADAGAEADCALAAALAAAPSRRGAGHLAELRELLTDVTRMYCEMTRLRDGHGGADRPADEPVFFLLAESDNFPELGAVSKPTADASSVAQQPTTAAAAPPPPPRAGPPAGPPRPFGFADLAVAAPSPPPVSEAEAEAESRSAPDSSDDGGDCAASAGRDDSGLADSDDQVYSVVTDRQLSGLMREYHRRKPAHAMPPAKRNPFLATPRPCAEPLPPEIELQRRSSLMKDSEAHHKVWTEMIVSTLDLVSQQDDATFRRLLSVVHPSVRALTAHAADAGLRQTLAEFYQRVGTVYGFAAE